MVHVRRRPQPPPTAAAHSRRPEPRARARTMTLYTSHAASPPLPPRACRCATRAAPVSTYGARSPSR
eukprot:scaffold114427_cov66-Phaeocystis_antarctica.AAC.1